MVWTIRLHDEFDPEFQELEKAVQDELLAMAKLLGRDGPNLGRPHADTLKGSQYNNMKELRFNAADGVWRAAFAFDPNREAILLLVGDKSGGSERKFYKRLIKKADERYAQHLNRLKDAYKHKEQQGRKRKKDK